jgi:hypothetical protein
MASDATISYSTREKWFFSFPVDAEGNATSDAAYRLIRYLFENHHCAYAIPQMADALVLHPELVRCMCRQLELIDLVYEELPQSGCYRYRLCSRNTDFQAKVEASLIDYLGYAARSGPPALARR